MNAPRFQEQLLKDVHKHSIRHRTEIEASKACACFFCGATFTPVEINSWTDAGETALCPKCGIDSVIGDACGAELSPAFISAMKGFWFKGT